MKQLAATALLAILALFATSAGQATAGHQEPTLRSDGTWTFAGLSPAARANVAADAARAIPSAQPVLDLLDGSIAVDTNASLCGPTGGCSRPEASQGRGWTMHMPPDWVSGTYQAQRFLVLHEIGHAAWHLVLRGSDRSAFIAAVQRSLAGQPCRQYRHDGPCAPIGEMFADEFARWAGGFNVAMSSYETPSLLTPAVFGAIIAEAMAHAR
jgi:hypothetical protein